MLVEPSLVAERTSSDSRYSRGGGRACCPGRSGPETGWEGADASVETTKSGGESGGENQVMDSEPE